jgi:hypothetical protein
MNPFVTKISVSKNHRVIALTKIDQISLVSLAQTDNANRLNGSINTLRHAIGGNKSQVVR